MAIREPLLIKVGSGVNSLDLTPLTGTGLKIMNVKIPTSSLSGAGARNCATFRVERTTVGYWRITSDRGNHLGIKRYGTENDSLYGYLVSKGIIPPIPVADGETFHVELPTGVTGTIIVEYQEYDAGDINRNAPNGSAATELYYVNYGTVSTATTTAGSFIFNASLNPVEFPDFPFGAPVPANSQIEIMACLGQTVGQYAAASDTIQTTRFRFQKERVELFDRDKLGFVMLGEVPTSAAVYYNRGITSFPAHKEDMVGEIQFFNPYLLFNAGETLNILATIAVGSAVSGAGAANTLSCDLLVHYKTIGGR
jgi:hypothetical protein